MSTFLSVALFFGVLVATLGAVVMVAVALTDPVSADEDGWSE